MFSDPFSGQFTKDARTVDSTISVDGNLFSKDDFKLVTKFCTLAFGFPP